MLSVSIVITCFNRAHCVTRAVRSALKTIEGGEVVVVDDASTDESVALISKVFSAEILSGSVKLHVLSVNKGVTGAKNHGYREAKGDWVIFLDSDDFFVEGVGFQLLQELKCHSRVPVVFFKCCDESGKIVGKEFTYKRFLSINEYLCHGSWGEALTAINKSKVGDSFSYPEALRGYEGIGCLDLIYRFGPAVLSTVVARFYVTVGADRLSSRLNFAKRAGAICDGHMFVYSSYKSYMSLLDRVKFLIKILAYRVIGLVGKVLW